MNRVETSVGLDTGLLAALRLGIERDKQELLKRVTEPENEP
jgi:hypothetical protein